MSECLINMEEVLILQDSKCNIVSNPFIVVSFVSPCSVSSLV